MKRISLLVLLSLSLTRAYAQSSTFPTFYLKAMTEVYGGGGLATAYNYDVATSAGIGFEKATRSGFYIGAHVLMQNYILFYDNEANYARVGNGYAGVTLNHASSYAFFLPTIRTRLWSRPGVLSWMYLNAGVGSLIKGTEMVHTWDRSYINYPNKIGPFDTFVDASANISKMVYRMGFGFEQNLQLGDKIWFNFREDVGYLISPITSTGDISNNVPPRTQYSPQKLNPLYISLQAGLTYMHKKK